MNFHLDLLMFAGLMGAILSGFPVAFSLAGIATIFAILGWICGVMDLSLLGAFGQRIFGLLTNQVLNAIPFFIFMGVILEKSRVADALLNTTGRLFGKRPGGLGVSVILVGALLAASTGIVGATVSAMGLIALPTLLRAGYDPRLSSGLVCSAGTLGQIIPPSTLLIILADVMSNANQQAQYEAGKFAIDTLSVGQFFAAALIPGIVLVGLYFTYIAFKGLLNPKSMPALLLEEETRPDFRQTLAAVSPPLVLILAVLGSILGGIATPTEAASCGAVGAILIAGSHNSKRKRLILTGALSLLLLAILANLYPVRLQRTDLETFQYLAAATYMLLIIIGGVGVWRAILTLFANHTMAEIVTKTLVMNSMIFTIVLAAGMFSLVFIGLGGEERIMAILELMPGGATGALFFCLALVFLLGFFLEFIEISIIVLPLIVPALIGMGHDPLWLGILLAMVLQTSFLTPPFGLSLFYLRAAAPEAITTGHIYRGVVPFIALQVLAVFLIWLFPQTAIWLPGIFFN